MDNTATDSTGNAITGPITAGESVTLKASSNFSTSSTYYGTITATDFGYNWYKVTGEGDNQTKTLLGTTTGTGSGTWNDHSKGSFTVKNLTETTTFSVEAVCALTRTDRSNNGNAFTDMGGVRKAATTTVTVQVKNPVTIDTSSIGALSKTYDGTAVSYEGTATAEGYTGDFTYEWYKSDDTKLTTAPKDAGSYYLKVSVPSDAEGYSGEAKIPFTISTATITVTPTAGQSKVYGEADTALTYTYTGAVSGETAGFTGALGRAAGENAGNYAITKGNLALADNDAFKASNYTLAFSEELGNFTINPKTLTDTMIADIANQTYTGKAIEPTVTVTDGSTTLEKDKDYTVTYGENLNAGEDVGTVKVTGRGNYTSEVTKTFTITPKALDSTMITAIPAQTYTGEKLTPNITLTYNNKPLVKDTDYTVEYTNNTAVGTATVTVAAKENSNYSGSATANFTIGTKPITADMITISGTYTYTGSAITPTVTVKYGNTTLTEGTDYTVALSNNTNAGEATVKITGTGNYSGEAETKFTIVAKALTSDDITVADIASQTYTGSEIKPEPEVKYGDTQLVKGTDYALSYAQNTNVGTEAKIIITGKGNYADKVEKTFTITAKALENGMITDIHAQTYSGSAIEPMLTVKYDTIILEKDKDYTVEYADNINAGSNIAKVTVTGTGNYSGTATANFTINKANQSLSAADLNAIYGKAFEATGITGAQGEVTYTVKSGSESLLTKGEDGKFTAKSGTGTAYITATAAGTDNYNQTSIDIPVVLSKATLTVKADDKSMYVNGTVPTELTVSYTGFVNGDTKDTVVAKDATASIAADVDGKTAGSFDIVVAQNTELKSDMSEKYTVSVQNGTLTVSRRSSGGGGGVSQVTYPVAVPDKTENGSVTVSPKSAKQGDTVTITVTPDAGYALKDVRVTDKSGKDVSLTKKSDTQYTFVMPAGQVEVNASFAKEGAAQSKFVDVKESDYFYDAVQWAAAQGITSGTDAEHFSPNASCTRAQIVTFLWRAAGSPEPKQGGSFTDVAAESYYAKAVAWAVENGITTGTGAETFSPDATCTREQAVAFLYRAAGSPAVSGGSAFRDVADSAYYANAVAWAEQNGITGGIGGGLFGAGNDCTRGQIVTFLYRANQEQ